MPHACWLWLLVEVQQPLRFAHFHRRARQQQEWEERQAERKARQAEMAGEPFDKEVRCSLNMSDTDTAVTCVVPVEVRFQSPGHV